MSGLTALVKTGRTAKNVSKAAPFYSAVDEAAAALTRGKGTGKEFMIEVLKKPGVKPTEIKERGLQKIEAMPKMTKEQFLDELEKRPAPQVEEKILRDPTKQEIEDHAHSLAYEDSFDELRAEGMNRHEAEDIAAEMAEDRVDDFMDQAREELMEGGDAPYHGNYTIAGGQNYREMLLKMPAFKDNKKLMELESMRRRVDPDTNPSRHQELTRQIEDLKAKKAAMPEQFKGLQQHFGGEPGILASIRVSDRIMPTYTKAQAEEIGKRIAAGMNVADPKNLGNGSIDVAIKQGLVTPKEAAQYADYRGFKGVDTTGAKQKVLHVEEIQSDWHQQGRKQGYKETPNTEGWSVKSPNPYEPNEVIVYDQNGKAVWTGTNRFGTDRQIIENVSGKLQEDKVPDAPFKKNWHELAMKRVLNYAAENGYDRVAITPGAEQADRYSLAKHISEIKYDPETQNFLAKDKDGSIVKRGHVPPEELPQYVGQDMAEKIAKGGEFSGLDLETGGEGMKGFYDKMLPDYLNSYGKKYGVQVTPFDITVPPKDSMATSGRVGADEYIAGQITWPEFLQKNPEAASEFVAPVHSFEITPEMRQDITGKGLPLYQQIGIPTGGAAAGMGALEQEDQGFAVGGPVGSQYDTTPDMNDGGQVVQGAAFKKGGRVHLSQNPDTMLLDLMSRN